MIWMMQIKRWKVIIVKIFCHVVIKWMMCVILWRATGKNSTHIQSLLPLQNCKWVPSTASKGNVTSAENLWQTDMSLETKGLSVKPKDLDFPRGNSPR